MLPKDSQFHGELEIKRSRFLATVVRIDSPEQARETINVRRAELPDARHHCTAFVVGVPGSAPALHSSDDSEPSGTAGRPILDVLLGIGITDAVAIVTRYFGGTLLGTGGLVRAYSGAVKEALEGAPLLSREIVPVWSTLLPHSDSGRYLSELANAGFAGTPEYLGEGVRVSVVTPKGKDLTALFAQLSGGTITPEVSGKAAQEFAWGSVNESAAMRAPG